MRRTRASFPARLARLAAAALLTLPVIAGVAHMSTAAPSPQEVEAAQDRLDALNQRLSLLVEEYNNARLALEDVRSRLAETRAAMDRASAEAGAAEAALELRAVAAFTAGGSEISSILGAGSFGEFTDRLEFLGTLAEDGADLAARAASARQEAEWEAERLQEAAAERAAILEGLDAKTDEIRTAIAEQKALVERYERELAAAEAARREAAEAAAQAAGASTPPAGLGGSPPPAPNPNAQAAIAAAYSVLGVKYTWGGASPQTGFDCSGLTLWAWAHAGISLPHSSQAQYASLPHVDRSQLQPGDLVFFYSPISHVGLYIGGGKMIDAPHTGTVVAVRAIMWDRYVGAARPG